MIHSEMRNVPNGSLTLEEYEEIIRLAGRFITWINEPKNLECAGLLTVIHVVFKEALKQDGNETK